MLYKLPFKDAIQQIEKKLVRICVLGLGRVGLPLALTLADSGFDVFGGDINQELVDSINKGICPFKEEEGLEDLMNKNVVKASTDVPKVIGDSDIIIVTVPTLIKENKKPDIDAIINVSYTISKNIKGGEVIVLESTVPPGTTENVLGKIIEQNGFKAGEDFGLVYSPERVQSPQILRDLRSYPKIIGGVDEKSAEIVSTIYSNFAPSIINLSSPKAAEVGKVAENIYRDVNIAIANEFARIAEILGVNFYEIREAANSQPFCHMLMPGAGVGGHCIPMDPYYLISEAEKLGYSADLFKTSRNINDSMPVHLADMVEKALKGKNKGKVTVLGLSFKPNIKSYEHSHTIPLLKELKERGFIVNIHDPYLDEDSFIGFPASNDLTESLRESDCFVISTAHSEYKDLNFEEIIKVMNSNIIVDGRSIIDPEKAKSLGFTYYCIGRGDL